MVYGTTTPRKSSDDRYIFFFFFRLNRPRKSDAFVCTYTKEKSFNGPVKYNYKQNDSTRTAFGPGTVDAGRPARTTESGSGAEIISARHTYDFCAFLKR